MRMKCVFGSVSVELLVHFVCCAAVLGTSFIYLHYTISYM